MTRYARLGALALSSLAATACTKPVDRAPTPANSSTPASSAPDPRLTRFLQAELKRDPALVSEEDLAAEQVTVRRAAVRALARIEDERSFPLLLRATSDEDGDVMSWAAFGVARLCHGHESDVVSRVALRAASLAAQPAAPENEQALGSFALALGRCASDDAERTLRAWLKLARPVAEAALLGLGQIARERRRLDEATVAALLDDAANSKDSPALYAIESVQGLGEAARARLLEVAERSLSVPGPNRAFTVRALSKAGVAAAPLLRRFIDSNDATDGERADAARSLAASGSSAQPELASALESRARVLIDENAWLTSQHGAVLTILDSLEPKYAAATVLKELARLPVDGDAPTLRRKIMLRCRAAALLAGRASANAALLSCDPSPPGQQREGALALVRVLGRGPLEGARGERFLELARSSDRVVREAALELLNSHEEAPQIAELLASALSAAEAGVRATAAKVLARYPGRAKTVKAASEDRNGATVPTDPSVVQALTRALGEGQHSQNIELQSALLDAAAALELLGAKPALERACTSSNPTLRKHAELGLAALGDRGHRCPNVAGAEAWSGAEPGTLRLDFDTEAGPLEITLQGDESPFAVQRFAELARAGFYDGMQVHRVVPGFVVQFGDPDGDGFGAPAGPPLRCQLGFDRFDAGSVGVALAGRDTGSSQFFVTLRSSPHLSGEYSLVGRAGSGWDRLASGDRIRKVRVREAPQGTAPR